MDQIHHLLSELDETLLGFFKCSFMGYLPRTSDKVFLG